MATLGNDLNVAKVIGTVKNFFFDREVYGVKYYKMIVGAKRMSGTEDEVVVRASEDVLLKKDLIGKRVEVRGEFRSYNTRDLSKRVLMFVFARSVGFVSDKIPDCNTLSMTGHIVKKGELREVLNDRKILDLVIAVNRDYSKTSYISCICWGGVANFVSKLDGYPKVEIEGRIQSRVGKNYPVYEVSISKLLTNERLV